MSIQKSDDGASGVAQTRRVTLRFSEQTYERLKYWSDRAGMSMNDYVAMAVESEIARDNGVLPEYNDLILARLNQLIDVIADTNSKIDNTTVMFNHGVSSIVAIAKGDQNMLLDDDIDGDL